MQIKNYPYLTFVTCILLCLLLTEQNAIGMEPNKLRPDFSLKGKWKFNIGDQIEYSEIHYDDNDWINIYVPDFWENQGFPGYDGYGWYRLHFKFHYFSKNNEYYLKLGQIDDVDEVYLNGKFIGSTGGFPPNYQTTYGHYRLYYIPADLINPDGENVLAVRVFDEGGGGGIYHGDVGIFSKRSIPLLDNYSGYWKFSIGDDLNWKNPDYNDSEWSEVIVPLNWEAQGYAYHDGYAWYRKKVNFSDSWKKNHLILVLGKIDDQDEVYFNGSRIGRTGFNPESNRGDYYKAYRFYYIPPHLIKWDGANQIAIRVFDYNSRGGIYEGPIGIIFRNDYLRIRKHYD